MFYRGKRLATDRQTDKQTDRRTVTLLISIINIMWVPRERFTMKKYNGQVLEFKFQDLIKKMQLIFPRVIDNKNSIIRFFSYCTVHSWGFKSFQFTNILLSELVLWKLNITLRNSSGWSYTIWKVLSFKIPKLLCYLIITYSIKFF